MMTSGKLIDGLLANGKRPGEEQVGGPDDQSTRKMVGRLAAECLREEAIAGELTKLTGDAEDQCDRTEAGSVEEHDALVEIGRLSMRTIRHLARVDALYARIDALSRSPVVVTPDEYAAGL